MLHTAVKVNDACRKVCMKLNSKFVYYMRCYKLVLIHTIEFDNSFK